MKITIDLPDNHYNDIVDAFAKANAHRVRAKEGETPMSNEEFLVSSVKKYIKSNWERGAAMIAAGKAQEASKAAIDQIEL